MNLKNITPETIWQLKPYLSARRIGGKGDVWLNANEYPESPSIIASETALNRYPECQPVRVIDAYARYCQLPPSHILTCRGSDEGIELLMRTFCQPQQDAIAYCPPTYGMYAVSANTLGIRRNEIPLTDDWQLDLPALLAIAENCKLIYLCNPNNPTGNLIKPEAIKTLLTACQNQTLVVVDEAYIEFCPDASVIHLLAEFPNLIILRTLSKAFALAGIRCGFVLANPDIIQLLLKVIAPYPTPSPVADIAAQALSEEGILAMRSQADTINNNKQLLIQSLQKIAYVNHIFNSESNYILVEFNQATAIFNALRSQGVILRDQQQHSQLANCIRITVGNRAENTALIDALQCISSQMEVRE